MVLLINPVRQSLSYTEYQIIKEYRNLDEALSEWQMTVNQLKEYKREGYCRVDIDTSDFMYILDGNTDRHLSDAVKTAIRDYKLNKIIQ